MAMYEYITNEGYRLLQRMLMGEVQIDFTRVEMGDGFSQESDLKKITTLSNAVVSLDVESVIRQENNTISISAMFSNEKMEKGFYFREKGLYAKGLDGSGIEQEILFSYANAGDTANYIDPPTVELVEKKIISHCTQCQKTDGLINFVIKSGIYVNKEEFEALESSLKDHLKNYDNPHNLKAKNIGLENVDNTSDEDKPVSKLQQKALDEVETNVKNYTDNKVDPLSESISNASPVSSVSGKNPTASNSTDGKLIYLNEGGYTEQTTLSGKNLLKNTAITQTVEGITLNVNNNGSITVNGTATGEVKVLVGNISVEESVSYIINGCPSNGDVSTYSLWFGSSGTKFDSGSGAKYDSNVSETLGIYIRIRTNVTVNNLTFYPMVRLATITDSTYEPYVGGTTSPNPSYPQRISSNGDKGYFDGVLEQGEYGYNSGEFTERNNAVTNKNLIPCNGNDTITVTYENSLYYISIVFYDESENRISSEGLTCTYSTSSASFTAPSKAKFFRFNLNNYMSDLLIADIQHICVTINGMYALRVKSVNKNLLKTDLASIKNTPQVGTWSGDTYKYHGLTYRFNNDGTITVNGTTAGGLWNNHVAYMLDVKKGKIYSGVITDDDLGFSIYSQSTYITKIGNGKYECIADGTIQVRFGVSGNEGVTYNNYIMYPMVVEGDVTLTSNDYEPHQESEVLIPISAPLYGGDYIELYADGSGREYHKMKSVIYDGSSDEYFQVQSINSYGIANFATALPSEAKNDTVVSSHFRKQLSQIASTKTEGIFNNIGTLYIRTNQERVSTVDELKTWLQSNPVHVVYEKATPTSTPLTAEQVQAFKQLQTFKGVTRINADGEVTVRYYCNNDSGDTVGMLHNMVSQVVEFPIGAIAMIHYNIAPSYGQWQYLGTSSLQYENGAMFTETVYLYKRLS